MFAFLCALVIICVVAIGVLGAFAWPHLTSGSRVLTPKGEEVVNRFGSPLRPLTSRLSSLVGRVLRPLRRRLVGPARAARRRLDPVLEPVRRAVEEGTVGVGPRSDAGVGSFWAPSGFPRSPLPVASAPVGPPQTGAPGGTASGNPWVRTVAPPTPRRAAAPADELDDASPDVVRPFRAR